MFVCLFTHAAKPTPVCAPGFGASNTAGSVLSCSKCTPGSFSPSDGTLPCQHCPAFTLAIDLQTSGKFGAGGTQCLSCPAGLVANDSQTGCRCPELNRGCVCPAGWASPTGGPPCVKCGPGNTYAAERTWSGSQSCIACPEGSVAKDGTGCVCRAGFHSEDGTPFADGGCELCPPGRFAAGSGSTKCLQCAPNTAPNADRTACVQSATAAAAAAAPAQQ